MGNKFSGKVKPQKVVLFFYIFASEVVREESDIYIGGFWLTETWINGDAPSRWLSRYL
jgi:hypothetical protein